jgi:hypothetical protein
MILITRKDLFFNYDMLFYSMKTHLLYNNLKLTTNNQQPKRRPMCERILYGGDLQFYGVGSFSTCLQKPAMSPAWTAGGQHGY